MNNLIVNFYVLPFAAAVIMGLGATFVIKKIASKYKIVDYPNSPRKIHDHPIPLLGGLAIYLSFLILTIIWLWLGKLADGRIQPGQILGILLAGLIIIIFGYLDDKYTLSPKQSIIGPIIASVVVIFFGLKIGYITNPLGGLIYLGQSLWSPLLIFLWLMGMMYTTKFLDGLDGLVAGVSVIGSFILFLVSLFWDVPLSGTSILCLILGGSTLGFLLWNYHPAKIFLGESGSIFLGFMLGVLAIISGAKIATTLLIMGIPILDVIWVIYRRLFREKKSPFSGDKKHLHFRLLGAGLSQRQAVLFLYLITALFGAVAVFQKTSGKIITLGVLIIFMIGLAWWIKKYYQQSEKKII